MNDHFRNQYFTALRTVLLLMILIYTILSSPLLTGASVWMLLLLALFTGVLSFKELVSRRLRKVFLAVAVILFIVIYRICGKETILLGVLTGYEILNCFRPNLIWYLLPAGLAFVSHGERGTGDLLISLLLCMIYVQNNFIVESYRHQAKEDTLHEQSLKHDIDRKEHEMQAEIQRSLLAAENQVLEERAQLSQTLHDKLGHNINGSVYQLEAVKVLMEQDPDRSRTMIQAVIDQLRTGMDEIRAILRNKRPGKHLLARTQLEKLCADCRFKGIDTELRTDGDLSGVPEPYLEIILDNCFESVSNALKYAKCTKITIQIHVMNKFIRCSITDNGVGCRQITEGMGISGMRRRVRQFNGILEISSDIGFCVSMLLPL